MQFAFLNPFWLLGALALVPLAAHLFSRTRPKRREFPSVLLLRQALRRVTRIRKPRDRWLLLLRTLAMAALALAFLQPWLLSRFGGKGAAKTAVLVVDVTASMGYADGTRTRLTQAIAAAEDVLAALPNNSKANIIWVQAQPAGLMPEPMPNLEVLRQSLRRATVRAEGGSMAAALSLALGQLAGSDGQGERELVVISDFQKSALRGVTWDVPANVRLTRIAAGEGDSANVALLDLATEPDRPVANEEARIICRVANYSGEPRRLTLFGEAGESRLSTPVELAPWSETLAVLPVKFPGEGLAALKASLAEDRFPADDVRHGVAEVRGALEVCIAGPPRDATAQAWLRAAQAYQHVVARRVDSVTPASIARPDVLLVADWDGSGVETLQAQLARGGALLLQPGTKSAAQAAALLTGQPASSAAITVQTREAPGWRVRIAREDHPLFALFAKGSYGDPVEGSFRRRLAVTGWPAPVLAYEDGTPALALSGAERPAAIALWNLDLGASDWAARPAYVSFFGELLRHLSLRSGAHALRAVEPGDLLRFDPGAAIDPKDVRLLDEKDGALKLASRSASAQLASETAPGPGSYRWVAQGAVLERAVVNFPAAESDLRRVTTEELSRTRGDVLTGVERDRLGDVRDGRPIWPWCLAAAALFLLAEGLILWIFAGERKEALA